MARNLAPVNAQGDAAERVRLDINDDASYAIWDVREADTGTVQMIGVTGSLGSVVATIRRSNSPNRRDFVTLSTLDATTTMSTSAIDLSAINYLGVFITTVAGGAAEADFVPCFKQTTLGSGG